MQVCVPELIFKRFCEVFLMRCKWAPTRTEHSKGFSSRIPATSLEVGRSTWRWYHSIIKLATSQRASLTQWSYYSSCARELLPSFWEPTPTFYSPPFPPPSELKQKHEQLSSQNISVRKGLPNDLLLATTVNLWRYPFHLSCPAPSVWAETRGGYPSHDSD